MKSRKGATRWSLGALALAVALGCGGQGREAKLEEARERVDTAEERLVAAEAMLEERREELEKARERWEAAEARVEEAEAELDEAREAVSSYTSDAQLFRTVQRRLLEDEGLGEAAVSVTVEDGVVTLTGEVPSEAKRERALEVAREASGVVDVESRIEVVEASAEGG